MTFKEVIPLLIERQLQTEAGLVIVQAVLENRIKNEAPYKAGREQQFLNLERQRVLRGLERLAKADEGELEIPTAAQLATQYSESRLNKYRDIERVKYFYDGLKFRYQIIRAQSDAEKIRISAEFAQELVFSPSTGSEDIDEETDPKEQYRLGKESDRKEYVDLLKEMQRQLKKISGIIFYDRK